jgi:hypothetical protein
MLDNMLLVYGRSVRAGSLQRCSCNIRSLVRQEPGQFIDSAGQVVEPAMRVAGRQQRRRMAGQFLRGSQVHSPRPRMVR